MKKGIKYFRRTLSQSGGNDIHKQIAFGNEENTFPAYPAYPDSDDIYIKDKETDLNPEDTSKIKKPYKKSGKKNVKKIMEDASGSDLDVPGNEPDEKEENEGSEDEENNFYSLGGDDHNDLDEDKGE
jgi:hypothetical protein